MAEVQPRDILLRVGGRTLQRYGVLAVAGAGRSAVEVVETFTRPDASRCATYIDRDGILRTAAANILRADDWAPYYEQGLLDALGNPLHGPRFEGTRTNLIENGDCESDVVGWVTISATVVRSNAYPSFGSWAADITTTNVASSGVQWTKRDTTRILVSPTTVYTVSAWLRKPAGGANVTLQFTIDWYTGAGAFISTSTGPAFTLISDGTRQRFAFTASAPGTAATAVPGVLTNVAQGVFDFWADIPQFEQGTFQSSAIPTLTGAVTRAADSLTVLFNWGSSRDITALARIARPVWAEAVGTLGINPTIYQLGAIPHLRANALSGSRTWQSNIDTGGTDQDVQTPIPAGGELQLCSQYRLLGTNGRVRQDVGSGFGVESGIASTIPAFGSQTLSVGSGVLQELHGVLLDLIFCGGPFTRAEMLAIP